MGMLVVSGPLTTEGIDKKGLIIAECGVETAPCKLAPLNSRPRRTLICLVAKEEAMSAYWMWWIAAAALVAAELLTGTFYLLVVAIALACGGVAAWLDAGVPVQWLIAAALGVIGIVILQRWKRGVAQRTPPL